MAQAYLTTYVQDYKWHDYRNPRRGILPGQGVYENFSKGDIWITSHGEDSYKNKTDEYLQQFVTKMYKKRYESEYIGKYCSKRKKEPEEITDFNIDEESELIKYGKVLFAPKTQKMLHPLPSSRKLFGYLAPQTLYGGLSEYQADIGQVGYNILLNNHLRTLGLAKE